ncbi:MAG: hypothetical protein ACFFDW_07825 [Candidatus Thorarchaeota archaeon]
MQAKLWIEDLKFYFNWLKEKHPDLFHKNQLKRFLDIIDNAQIHFQDLDDIKCLKYFYEMCSLIGDGHSCIIAPNEIFPQIQYIYPLKIRTFDEGPIIFATSKKYCNLLGTRIVKFNGLELDDLALKIKPYLSFDNMLGFLSHFDYAICFPFIHYFAGTIDKIDQVIELELENNITVEIEPFRFAKEKKEQFISLFDDKNKFPNLPYYMQHCASNYFFDFIYNVSNNQDFMLQNDATKIHHIKEFDIIYADIRKILNLKERSFRDFSREILNQVIEKKAKILIIDLSNNMGGNNYLNQSLYHEIIKTPEINSLGKIFTIISRNTFSAAANLATNLELETWALFVGEPTAAPANHYSDPAMIRLPNSQLMVTSSTIRWQMNDDRDLRPYIYPDVPVKLQFNDLIRSKDPIIEAILNFKLSEELKKLEDNSLPNEKWNRTNQKQIWEIFYKI